MTQPANFPQIELKVSALECTRGERLVFVGLDLACSASGAVLLTGANGTGKSSLLLALAGLIHTTGNVAWSAGGQVIEEPQTLIHFSGHRHAIKPDLTLSENLNFWARMFGGDPGRVERALNSAGLEGLGAYAARNLSAGQTHRLALCRLLVAPRPVWLLDEPSSALDAQGDNWVAGLIDTQLAAGGLVIAATHRQIPLKSKRTQTLDMGAGA